MNLVFFDESKNDDKYPHYHIGAICIEESALKEVEERLSVLAERVFGSRAMTRETEFHAGEIFHRSRRYRGPPDFNDRLRILSELADILALPLVRRIWIQINCDYLAPSQSAEEIAFMYLCERANGLMRASRSLGMLIGDRENDQVSDHYSQALSAYRVDGTEFRYGQEIHNLVDSVHFTHSHLSRFLQLADLYSWILQFRNRNRNSQSQYHVAALAMLDAKDLFASKYKEWPKPPIEER